MLMKKGACGFVYLPGPLPSRDNRLPPMLRISLVHGLFSLEEVPQDAVVERIRTAHR